MNKLKLKKNLIIGSANFVKTYGADPVKIKKTELKKILNLSKKNHIYEIDTAEAYIKKKSPFKEIDKKFKFSTKILPNEKWVSLKYCCKKITDHFKQLNRNKVETLLFHDTKILLKTNGIKIFKNIESLKNIYFNKIGVSIYDTKYLNKIINNYNIDVVQFPYNILDKRMMKSGWFKKLKSKGIQVHARSVFLQGLLVNKEIYKKKYFKKWDKYFYNWFLWLDKNNISPIDYCMSDLLNYNFDKVVIGINNYENLNKIINFKKINRSYNFSKLRKNNIKLIDPRCWRIE
tara:strand:+ start:974 stop:1840 length:867 start_codon:yes stop_codon:yes gene_type:complete